MLANHLSAAWRHFTRKKGFPVISVTGLGLALAACIFIGLFVVDELTYDQYNRNADRIFRVAADLHINGGNINDVSTPPAMAAALVRDFPSIESAVRIRDLRRDVTVHTGDKVFTESDAVLADAALFSIFTFPMIAGSPGTALSAPSSVVLSATAAKRYFNSTDVLGRTLRLDEDTTVYAVTGIMRDMPARSHIHFNLIRSLQQRREEWVNLFAATYILVRPGTSSAAVDTMLARTVDRYVTPQIQRQLHNSAADLQRNGDHFRYYSIPLTRIHLYSQLGGEFEANGNIQYVVVFMIIAVLILVIACINFVNLSIANSTRRLREIGMRRILGSNRRRLIGQFLVESMVLTGAAMVVAIGLVLVLLPWFNRLAGKSIDVPVLLSWWTFPGVVGIVVVIGLLSGGYPAFVLSGIQPLTIMRGQLGMRFRAGILRRALLVFQFSIAMILIIGTGVIYSQLYYIRHRDLGYQREQVVTIRNTRSLGDGVWTFAREARQLPGVADVTVSGNLPNQKVVLRGFFKDHSATVAATVLLGDWTIDADYLSTLGMKLVSGRNSSPLLPTDSGAVLINETAARVLGYRHPVGGKIYTGNDLSSGYRIIGVVKDFNTGSLRNPVDPMVFRLARDGNAVTLRLVSRDIPGTLKSLRSRYQALAKGYPFTYAFLDDDFNRLYAADQRTSAIFTTFSILAILIAGIGMFGLVAAAAAQRTKEMGIRRVIGARVLHLVLLLSKDYGVAIGVAVCIALPTGAWVMHSWLQGFAFRTELQPWIFAAAPLVAISLSILIVGVKAIRASRLSLSTTLREQ